MHIKCLEAKFETQEDMKQYVDFYKFSQCTYFNLSEGECFADLDIELDTTLIYDLSLDQSSTCTGIFLRAIDNSTLYVLEVKRTKNSSADDYIFDFELFLNELTKDLTLLHLIYERPINTSTFRSSQVAFQLEGAIRQLVRRYPQFKYVLLDSIEPTSWKSCIVNTSRWGKDYTSKQASKESIIELFPWAGYYGSSINKDNDGYEAIGILFGWYFSAFDPFGRPYVRGQEFTGNVGCIVMPEMEAESLASSLTEAEIDAKWFVYNPKFSTFKNIMKSAEKYKVSVIQVEDLYTALCICIEANLKPPASGKLSVVVATPENMSAAAKRVLGDTFHFYL